ncbi:MAG: hypothetical protein GW771_13895 [Flavobacteriia bacterium]|nr:hypothetical protein [Flavobacteriia bacterium]PIV96205.1 MAG: hypothetical protein COW43_09530 [Flavobacteriaceae bacterium CG17_big_fil_post_rev_8_21_14_2_50_31_13]
MKKVLLSQAFVLAIGSSAVKASDNENLEFEPTDCTQVAIESQTLLEEYFDMETASSISTYIYYKCILDGGQVNGGEI